jgi:hypothetical protein
MMLLVITGATTAAAPLSPQLTVRLPQCTSAEYPCVVAAGVPGIKGKIPVFSFSPQAMERAGMPSGAVSNCPPFMVIASNDINQGMLNAAMPMYWPERAYKWGTAEAYNPEHSDLLALR